MIAGKLDNNTSQNKLFSSKSSEFENEALDIHNEYRRDHGAPRSC
ncbi:unnamed protein product [Plutella xylostella]|uniref:(diamondback moth) hypothetical protein n=1 Tax=Plutella xylostella TaxID=51655 RepID=A0A8S4E680_PLUXY|nr:unnamed protein product [Plutella xylostella]